MTLAKGNQKYDTLTLSKIVTYELTCVLDKFVDFLKDMSCPLK